MAPLMTWMEQRIPERFRSATLESYEPKNESQRTAKSAVGRWLRSGGMLALVGPTGTGKSHLLWAAVRSLYELGQHAGMVVRPWYRLADELRYGRVDTAEAGSVERSSAYIRDSVFGAKRLVIDEVRPTSGTSFDADELMKIAANAYDNMQHVLLTTNTNPLNELMGAPAASRFAYVVLVGPDGRAA